MKRSPNGTCRPAPTQISEKMTDDAANENLLKLNIYFGSKSVTTVTEIATYSGVIIFGSVKEPKESLCVSVCLSGTSLSKALNLHLSLMGLSLFFKYIEKKNYFSMFFSFICHLI